MRKFTAFLSLVCLAASIVLVSFIAQGEDKKDSTISFQEAYEKERVEYHPEEDKKVSPYMVKIIGFGETDNYGTGIIIGQNDEFNYVLTNRHVIDRLDKINCTYFNNWTYDAYVLYESDKHDIAVIATKYCPLTETVSISTEPLELGESIKQEGNAHGDGIATSFGKIVKLNALSSGATFEHGEYIMSDNQSTYGCSGGAITSKGELKGINFAINTKKQLNFIIPIVDILDEIKMYVTDTHPFFTYLKKEG